MPDANLKYLLLLILLDPSSLFKDMTVLVEQGLRLVARQLVKVNSLFVDFLLDAGDLSSGQSLGEQVFLVLESSQHTLLVFFLRRRFVVGV